MVASLSKVNGRMKIKGDETVAVGDIIKVVGFGKFSGSLLVTGVQHDLSESGGRQHCNSAQVKSDL